MDIKLVKDRESFEKYWNWVHENHESEWDDELGEFVLSKKVSDYPKFPDHMIYSIWMFSKEGWNQIHEEMEEQGVHKNSDDISLATAFIEYLTIFQDDNDLGFMLEKPEKKIGDWYIFYNEYGNFHFRTKHDMSEWDYLLGRWSDYLLGD